MSGDYEIFELGDHPLLGGGVLKGARLAYKIYCKVAHAKLYTTKTPITAADLLNDRVLPFHEEYDMPVADHDGSRHRILWPR